MAINSIYKRRNAARAAIGGFPGGFGYPYPGGGITVADRYQIAGYYYHFVQPFTETRLIFTAPDDTTKIEFDTPLWGYKTSIRLPLYFANRSDGTLQAFDAGKEYDKRICTCRFMVDKDHAKEMIDFFRDPLLGRGNKIKLTLPSVPPYSGTGWFPFAPDKGDYGVYVVQVLNVKPLPQIVGLSQWFYIDMDILYISGPLPEYIVVDGIDYGNMSIGPVNNIRYPEDGFNSIAKYGIDENLLMAKSVGVIDTGVQSDSWIVDFIYNGTRSKTAEFINFLTNINRDSDLKIYPNFDIVTQDNNFIFGVENLDSGTYSTNLLKNEIVLKHINYDSYQVELSLLLFNM
jgi:hypothetical protein